MKRDKLESPTYRNLWMPNREQYYKEIEKVADLSNAVYYIVGSDAFITSTVEMLKKNK